MTMDLIGFKTINGLGWRSLAEFLGHKNHNRVKRWAIGEHWPDADLIESIVRRTHGQVTLAGMHERRLQWLRDNRGLILEKQSGEAVTAPHFDDAPPPEQGRIF